MGKAALSKKTSLLEKALLWEKAPSETADSKKALKKSSKWGNIFWFKLESANPTFFNHCPLNSVFRLLGTPDLD